MAIKGTIKFYRPEKGFGFIRVKEKDNVMEEYFFHKSQLRIASEEPELKHNTVVSFDILKTNRGMQAEDVKIINSTAK
jgi:cold shock CspA family protein